MPSVLIVSTSAGAFKGGPTGVWIEELATPYYAFLDAGLEVTLASPAGGAIPIDAGSMGGDFLTDSAKKFLHDPVAMGMLGHSLKLEAIMDKLGGFDALYLPGGHGCCTDFVNNPVLTTAIETMYASDSCKVVAADCHGPAAFADCKKPDGTPLVAGLAVTVFSDLEESQVGQTDNVPFLLESKFKELGGLYESADPWNPKAVTAGKLVTGQNPQSSEVCAAATLALLK